MSNANSARDVLKYKSVLLGNNHRGYGYTKTENKIRENNYANNTMLYMGVYCMGWERYDPFPTHKHTHLFPLLLWMFDRPAVIQATRPLIFIVDPSPTLKDEN